MKSPLDRSPLFALCVSTVLVLIALHTLAYSSSTVSPNHTLVLEIKGIIGPAFNDYIQKNLVRAEREQAGLVILEMDTPGGLDSSMRDIVKNVLSSPVPVVTYVSPNGSRAASAGTYILYASHVAAMAPATNLGAATPIRMGGLPGQPDEPGGADEEQADRSKGGMGLGTLERKMINDAEAYIKALADHHGRNSKWAAEAVRNAASLTAAQALESGVIDIVADDIQDLLQQLDGRKVTMETGSQVLATKGMVVTHIPLDWRGRLLVVITHPNIAYVLLLLGIYGLFFELANPGFIVPGVIGAISLVLAMYTFQVLPINYAGLALILLGLAFMVAEAFVPSFGVLGIGGIVSFVVGSVILMDKAYLQVSLVLVGGTALVTASFFCWVGSKLFVIRRKKIRTGVDGMIGGLGEAMEDFDGEGRVWIQGESWRGYCREPVKKGQQVRVVTQEGLLLQLELSKEE